MSYLLACSWEVDYLALLTSITGNLKANHAKLRSISLNSCEGKSENAKNRSISKLSRDTLVENVAAALSRATGILPG